MINFKGPWEEDRSAVRKLCMAMASESSEQSEQKAPQPEGADHELEDAARDEHEYVQERLREELGREPTDEEMNEWLRQHTEGY
jgi:hypothetical protein